MTDDATASRQRTYVRRIAETLRRAYDRGRPAHLLIGAGCSRSAGIPLAGELVEEIRTKYAAYCEELPEAESTYGRCMSLLSANERRDLLSPYLNEARLNWGHLAIAQMMKEGLISRVLTVNFDNLLVRACGLLGIHPAIYDFAAAPTDERSVLVSPAIVHLHGQGYGVRLMNTDEETQAHAKQIGPVVRLSLNEQPLVVIGYSGSSDDLFSVFRRDHADLEKMYWLGWTDAPPDHVAEFLKPKGHASYVGGCDADLILIEVARAARCWPPQVFEDPAGHLLASVEAVGPFPSASQAPALDLLADLRQRLTEHRETLKSGSAIPNMIMKGQFREAATQAQARPDETSSEIRAWLLFNEATEIARAFEENNIGQDKFSSAEEKFREVMQVNPGMHGALNNWGNLLRNRAQHSSEYSEAARYFDEAVSKYEAALKIKQDKHETLDNLAATLASRIRIESDEATRIALLDRAEQASRRATDLDRSGAYNLACILALKGDTEGCRRNLDIAAEAGTLPDADHLMSDPDLASFREEPWFKELVEQRRSG